MPFNRATEQQSNRVRLDCSVVLDTLLQVVERNRRQNDGIMVTLLVVMHLFYLLMVELLLSFLFFRVVGVVPWLYFVQPFRRDIQ
jgi:hypothetical protein